MTSDSLPNSKISEFDITPIQESTKNFLGYYVTSTASINVEDNPYNPNTSAEAPITEIAQYLGESSAPQIVIAIHGYATKRSDAKKRHQKIYNYASRICTPKTSVFLGYCWPSENPSEDDPDPNTGKSTSFTDKVGYALQSLPTLLIGIFTSTLVLGIITAFLLTTKPNVFAGLLVFPLIGVFSILLTLGILKLGQEPALIPALPIGVLFGGLIIGGLAIFNPIHTVDFLVILLIVLTLFWAIILALIALRLSTYLRDGYRAEYYGVLDFVELIRKLDLAVFETQLLKLLKTKYQAQDLFDDLDIKTKWDAADDTQKIEIWRSLNQNSNKKLAIEQEAISGINKIKLSFIGHSLGCLVVTSTIRILSDVFDTNSINENPSPEIGRAFRLGRLILVAPDIPIETIMPRRANFLRSSLRRCEEAYVFSNEGDLALRLASTAANYFRFPARTRFSGYKLGNLTVRHYDSPEDHHNRRLDDERYGIVNCKDDSFTQPYFCLEIRASDRDHKNLNERRPIESIEKEKIDSAENANVPIADLFTYFDCTDYTDCTEYEQGRLKGVVSHALRKSALNLWDYFQLSLAYFLKPESQKIDVHGGYFEGKFSQKAMYELAFVGFENFLEILKPGCHIEEQLSELSRECRDKYIQLVLSPWLMKRRSSN